jgi:hypothetical protein
MSPENDKMMYPKVPEMSATCHLESTDMWHMASAEKDSDTLAIRGSATLEVCTFSGSKPPR